MSWEKSMIGEFSITSALHLSTWNGHECLRHREQLIGWQSSFPRFCTVCLHCLLVADVEKVVCRGEGSKRCQKLPDSRCAGILSCDEKGMVRTFKGNKMRLGNTTGSQLCV